MFFGMPIALFPAFAGEFGGAGVLGLLYAAPAVGSLVATLTSGWTGRVHRHGAAICSPRPAGGGVVGGRRRARPRAGAAGAGRGRGRPTRCRASSARRSGTRRSRTSCAGGWPASSRSATRPGRCWETSSRAWPPRWRGARRRSSRAARCAWPAWRWWGCCCRRSGATTPGIRRLRQHDGAIGPAGGAGGDRAGGAGGRPRGAGDRGVAWLRRVLARLALRLGSGLADRPRPLAVAAEPAAGVGGRAGCGGHADGAVAQARPPRPAWSQQPPPAEWR